MSVVVREGLLRQRPSDGAVLVGYGCAHALHGNMRRFGRVGADAIDNQGELKECSQSALGGNRRSRGSTHGNADNRGRLIAVIDKTGCDRIGQQTNEIGGFEKGRMLSLTASRKTLKLFDLEV